MTTCIDFDIAIESLEVGVIADDTSDYVPIGIF